MARDSTGGNFTEAEIAAALEKVRLELRPGGRLHGKQPRPLVGAARVTGSIDKVWIALETSGPVRLGDEIPSSAVRTISDTGFNVLNLGLFSVRGHAGLCGHYDVGDAKEAIEMKGLPRRREKRRF